MKKKTYFHLGFFNPRVLPLRSACAWLDFSLPWPVLQEFRRGWPELGASKADIDSPEAERERDMPCREAKRTT